MQRIFAAILALAVIACSPRAPPPGPSDAGATAPVARAAPPTLRDAAPAPRLARGRLKARPTHGAQKRTLSAKAPDARIIACTRSATDKTSLMACLDALTRPQPVVAPGKLGALGPPIINPAWSIPTWYINPSTGSNDNTCVASGSPCKTMGEIVARWQTDAPTISVAVTIWGLASWAANTDWIRLKPILVQGGSLAIRGSTTAVCTGHTLASLVAKDRSAGNADGRMHADLGACASGAPGLLIVNLDRASSVAWVDSCAGTVCKISQPIESNVPTFNTGIPPQNENNAWANGDNFAISRPPLVNVADFEPDCIGNSANGFPAGGYLGNIWIPNADPFDAGAATTLRMNTCASLVESRSDAFVEFQDTFVNDNEANAGNAWLNNGGIMLNVGVRGGVMNSAGGLLSFSVSGIVTDDVIYHTLVSFGQRASDVSGTGPIYSDSQIEFFNDTDLQGDVQPGILYGSYTLQGGAAIGVKTTLFYTHPATTAFGGVPTWQMCGGGAVASAWDRSVGGVGGSPFYAGRTLNATNLDAVIGGPTGSGFDGLAVCDDGTTVEADNSQKTATPSTYLNAGANVTITPNSPATGQVTIAAASGAVSSVSGTSGVSCSPTTGAVVCSNTGATSVTGSGLVSCSPTTGAVTCSATDPVQVAHGGTSSTTLTAHDLIVGNGTSAVNFLAPGAGGNTARSDGTNWFSSVLPASFFSQGNGTANNPCDSTIFAGVTVPVPSTGAIVDVTAALTVGSAGLPTCNLTWGVAIDNTACSFSVSTEVTTTTTSGGFAGSALTYEISFGSAGSHTFDIQAGASGGTGCATISINDAHIMVVAH